MQSSFTLVGTVLACIAAGRTTPLPQQPADAGSPAPSPSPSPSLSLLAPGSRQVSLPFELQDGFILLPAELRGVPGVLLFDTGTPFPLLVNNTVVPLALIGPGSPGAAGSGQTFRIHRHADVGPVSLGGERFAHTGAVISGDIGWLNQIFRASFLGFAGQPLVREHEMLIDYQSRQLSLFRLDAEGRPLAPHTPGREGGVTLPFEGFDAGRVNLPYVMAEVAGVRIEVMFDTGTNGSLNLSSEGRRALEAAGALRPAGPGLYTLDGLRLGGQPAPNRFPAPTDGPQNRLTMGYASLALYRSIWNYPRGEITLIPLHQPAPPSPAAP